MNSSFFSKSCASALALSSTLLLGGCLEDDSNSVAANGKNGTDGTSCTAEELDDESGYELTCGGKIVGIIKNGIDGKDGANGKDGKDGEDGIDGARGKNGKDGISCTAEELDDGSGYNIVCGGEVLGTLYHGINGQNSSSSIKSNSGTAAKSSSSTTVGSSSSAVIRSSANISPDRDDYGLGECTMARHGDVAKFSIDNQYYICRVGSWQLATELEYETYGYNCNEDFTGTIIPAYVSANKYYICTNTGWQTPTQFEVDTYKQPCTVDNIGEIIDGKIMPVRSYICTNTGWHLHGSALAYGNIWSSYDYQERAITGLDDGSETSGIWFSYNDANNQGDSYIKFPTAPISTPGGGTWLTPIITKYGSIIGSFTLGAGYKYPFVGVGFNITSENITGADISSWGGLCIVYEATGTSPTLEIAPQDESNYTEYNNYAKRLAVANEPTLVNLTWADFKQDTGWGVSVAQSEFLTHAAAIRFKLSGTAGKTGDFAIYAVGTYKNCFTSVK